MGRSGPTEGKSILEVSETDIEDRVKALLDVVLVAEGGGSGGASFLYRTVTESRNVTMI